MGTSEGARKGWTEESRQKRAEAMRRKWQDPEYRARRAAKEQDPQTKTNRSVGSARANADPERRRKHSEYMAEKWATDIEFRERQANGVAERLKDPEFRKIRSEATARVAAANPPTRYELAVAQFLNELNIPYQLHAVREGREMDLYVPSCNLNIEVDGYSHQYRVSAGQDGSRDESLTESGYTILRLRHREIDKGVFANRLREALDQPEV